MLEIFEILRLIASIAGLLAFPIIFVGALIFILRKYVVRDKRRSEQFQKFAGEKGFFYSGSHPISDIKGAEYFRLFNLGNGYGKQIENSIHGAVNDFQTSVFDYTYYVTFSHQKIRRQTVVSVYSSRLNLPLFFMQPKGRGLLQNLANNLTEQTDFSDKELSDKYLFGGQDLQRIKSVFNDRVISHFKTTTESLVVEGGGNRIFLYRDGITASPEQFQWMMQEAVKIAYLFTN